MNDKSIRNRAARLARSAQLLILFAGCAFAGGALVLFRDQKETTVVVILVAGFIVGVRYLGLQIRDNLVRWLTAKASSSVIDTALLASLPIEKIDKITFYKLDRFTDDLICCDVSIDGQVRTFHEDLPGWESLIETFHRLDGFKSDWFECVSTPPFATSEILAFARS